jgi:uncharacterized protein (TIGR03437 family)
VSIFGSGLGPEKGVGATVSAGGVVATVAGGTRVLFDGLPAPLLYVRSDQINAIVPYGLAGRAAAAMVVEASSARSDTLQLRVDNTAPAVFTADGSGTGQGAIVNQDGTVNSPLLPAARESIVAIYGTGEGQTRPAGQDGRVISTDLRAPAAPVAVTIGGVPAEVRYAGSAPSTVSGVHQINVFLPRNVPVGGNVPVEVSIGGVLSQYGVTMAVK